MKHILHLHATGDMATEASAWFIPGEDPAVWIDELAFHGLANDAVRLGIVRVGGADATPSGALVMLGHSLKPGTRLAGIACRLLGRHLCVPVDARPQPALSLEEADSLCGPDYLIFLHPSLGAFGFAESDLMGLADFLEKPVESGETWNLAPIAEPLPPLLQRIEFVPPPTADLLTRVFGLDAESIASSSPAEIQKLIQKQAGASGAASDEMLNTVARGALEITRHLPAEGKGEGWADKLREWALEKLGRQGLKNPRPAELESLRERELEQLAQLLETDPDAGLKHAIPLSGPAHRGLAQPGSNLPSRPVDYKRAGGAAPQADIWDVQDGMRRRLRDSYLTLTEREVALGRYRRAAFIHAELLGDFASAANALVQGRHFREAAELFEERLKDPLQAARCLVEGGLLREALTRFERLGRLPDIAELYQKLGEPENAVRVWRQLVDQHLEVGNRISAAHVLENQLHAHEEALAVLEAGWPRSPQSLRCLGAQCALLDRLRRPRAFLEVFTKLNPASWPEDKWTGLLSLVSSHVRHLTDSEVRARGEDWLRVEVSRRLRDPRLPQAELNSILECLNASSEADPLLSRDLGRFQQERAALQFQKGSHGGPAAHSAPASKLGLRRSDFFHLPQGMRWLRILPGRLQFFALGINSARVMVVRGDWSGGCQSVTGALTDMPSASGFRFEALGSYDLGVALFHRDLPALSLEPLPSKDLLLGSDCKVETPAWLPTRDAAFVYEDSGAWALYQMGHRTLLSSYTQDGKLRKTVDSTDWLPAMAFEGTRVPPTLLATCDGLAVVVGAIFGFMGRDGEWMVRTCSSAFLGFASARPEVAERVGLCLKEGIEILSPLGGPALLVPDSASAHAAWIARDELVFYNREGGTLIRIDDDSASPIEVMGHFRSELTDIIGVVPTGQGRNFALVDAAGRVQIWGVDGGLKP